MTDQQLKLAIARECPQLIFNKEDRFRWIDSTDLVTNLEWLAVMWEVERHVNGSVYSDWLEKITGCGTVLPKRWTWNAAWQQRAEAYLRTINKYEEEEK